MKRIIAMVLTVISIFTLSACSFNYKLREDSSVIFEDLDVSNKVKKFYNKMSAGFVDDAVSHYYEIVDSQGEEGVYQVKQVCIRYHRNINSNYLNGTYDEERLELELNKIKKTTGLILIDYGSECDEELSAIKKSKENFRLGKIALEEKKYTNAIECFSEVMQGDCNYDEANKQISASKQWLKDEAITKAENEAANGDLESAINTIESANLLLESDSELEELLYAYAGQYIDEKLKQADTLVLDSKYEEAINVLENSIVESEDIDKKIQQIKNIMPVSLGEVKVVDSDCYEYINEMVTDSYGKDYKEAFVLSPCDVNASYSFSDNGDETAYVVYNLNGDYSKFSGKLVAFDYTSSESNFKILAYIDNETEPAFTYTDFNKRTGSVNVDIDIQGATKLTFEVYQSGVFGGCNEPIALVNTVLFK